MCHVLSGVRGERGRFHWFPLPHDHFSTAHNIYEEEAESSLLAKCVEEATGNITPMPLTALFNIKSAKQEIRANSRGRLSVYWVSLALAFSFPTEN